MDSLRHPGDHMVLRLFVAAVGAYAVASGFAAICALGFAATRMPPPQASQTSALLGLVVYVAAGLGALIAEPIAAMAVVFFVDGSAMLVLAACVR